MRVLKTIPLISGPWECLYESLMVCSWAWAKPNQTKPKQSNSKAIETLSIDRTTITQTHTWITCISSCNPHLWLAVTIVSVFVSLKDIIQIFLLTLPLCLYFNLPLNCFTFTLPLRCSLFCCIKPPKKFADRQNQQHIVSMIFKGNDLNAFAFVLLVVSLVDSF